jgi:hypothetical protein
LIIILVNIKPVILLINSKAQIDNFQKDKIFIKWKIKNNIKDLKLQKKLIFKNIIHLNLNNQLKVKKVINKTVI